MSQRRDVIKVLIDNLKLIDGTRSPLGSYSFKTNLHENVFRGFKTIEEINDFPSIYMVAGSEARTYNTVGTSQSSLALMIRVYTYDEEDKFINEHINDIVQDIEHVVYNLPRTYSNLEILDITIVSINTDEGLLTPYGIVELQIQARYEVTL
jgi:hypothetical protein